MSFAGMNYLAIVLAAIAAFGFGSIYYMSLSGPWLAAVGKRKEDMKPAAGPFIATFIAQFVMAWVLAGTLAHLGPGQVTLKNGIITAGFIWLGFVLTSMVVNNAFAGRKTMLTVIDGIHWLGVLVIQGAVIGAMGVKA